MSQEKKLSNENDINVLEQMDDVIEDIHICTQKGASLVSLNVSATEAFSEVFKLINTLEDLASQVVGETARVVATGKIQVVKLDLEVKLGMHLKK